MVLNIFSQGRTVYESGHFQMDIKNNGTNAVNYILSF